VTWFEALAFCAWDGGRIPTEAEWMYAAAGGAQNRQYPWGSAAPDASYVVYNNGALPPIGTAGSKSPLGDGLFGQADLAGNMWEWNLDWSADYQASCTNCANVTRDINRVIRGGSFVDTARGVAVSNRSYDAPTWSSGYLGVRCARTP
jgi:formylglycine-generating enzyme